MKQTNNNIKTKFEQLIDASINGDIEIVRLLIENGVDIHEDNDEALACASLFDNNDIVKLLLDNGADIYAKNNFALRWSAKHGHINLVRLLIVEFDMFVNQNTINYLISNNCYEALDLISKKELKEKLSLSLKDKTTKQTKKIKI